MIIVRAPMRISFVGGGTDLPDFFHNYPGQVISTAIDKFVYIVINPAPLLKGVHARYSIIESVKKPSLLKNTRIREVMMDLKVDDDLEIGTFSHLKAGVGLGGSSSFTVALIKAFSTLKRKRLDKKEIAELACKIEMTKLKEPIGKQDQYAAAMGGFNIFQFNKDDSVSVKPLHLDYKTRINFERNVLLFFTGITRSASTVLSSQKRNTKHRFEELKKMADLVPVFKRKLLEGNFEYLGNLLHQNWIEKKKLASTISSSVIDDLYDTAIKNGAFGGKVAGAGGGGCLLLIVSPRKRQQVKSKLEKLAKNLKLKDFKEVPIKFIQSGVEVVSSSVV